MRYFTCITILPYIEIHYFHIKCIFESLFEYDWCNITETTSYTKWNFAQLPAYDGLQPTQFASYTFNKLWVRFRGVGKLINMCLLKNYILNTLSTKLQVVSLWVISMSMPA